MINQQRTGIRWNLCSSFEELIYADNLALRSHTREQVQRKISNLEQQASSIGLSVNAKTKVLTNSNLTQQRIVINNHRLEYVNKVNFQKSKFGMFGCRYLLVLVAGMQAHYSKTTENIDNYFYQQNDLCILRLFEAFLESAPQLTLQLYIIMCTQTAGWLTGLYSSLS